jgi:BirA family biotin operon repressor/biotin-[acetyl-CoA-carboxylase] ligase
VIGAVIAARRALPPQGEGDGPALAWRLRGLPVCASTEVELERWLAAEPQKAEPPEAAAPLPRVVLARRQRFGRGQRGRLWQSPAGGAWLSAALPWPEQPGQSAAPGLAVAVGLALELEALGLPVTIKWPNDLLLGGRKVAGLLPRLRLRGGRIRWAQVGVGLNGRHRLPPGAAGVPLAAAPLTARVLRALEWAVAQAACIELVRSAAQARLGLPLEPLRHEGELWQVEGLGVDGSLLLCCGHRRTALHRRF